MDIFRSKEYVEAWAAFALIKVGVITAPFSKDWLSDRPDLQIGDMGVEVVNAVDPFEGEQRNFQQQLADCTTYTKADELSQTNYFKKSQVKVKPLGDTELPFVYTSSFNEDKTSKRDATEIIIEKIKEKNCKFSKYPECQRFTKKGLFIHKTDDIFLETPTTLGVVLSSLDIAPIKDATEQSVFDMVFIYLPTKIIIISKNEEKPTDFIFGKRDVEDICLDTLQGIESHEYEKFKKMVEQMRFNQ